MRTGLPQDLGTAAQAYLDAFPPGDVVAFPIHQLDALGLPVWVVALFPEGEALSGIMPYGVGYGATDEAAVLGALGDAVVAALVGATRRARDVRLHERLALGAGRRRDGRRDLGHARRNLPGWSRRADVGPPV